MVGDHASAHLQHDAPLTSDIAGLARPLSHWVHRSAGPQTVGEIKARTNRLFEFIDLTHVEITLDAKLK